MTCGMKGFILYLPARTARVVLAGLFCALLPYLEAAAQVPNLVPGARVAAADL